MEKLSLIRRDFDCRVCGREWITLSIGETVIFDSCVSLLIVGENIQFGNPGEDEMNKTEFWEAVLIDDESLDIIDARFSCTAGELQKFLARWNDEQLVLMRASICFGRVD